MIPAIVSGAALVPLGALLLAFHADTRATRNAIEVERLTAALPEAREGLTSPEPLPRRDPGVTLDAATMALTPVDGHAPSVETLLVVRDALLGLDGDTVPAMWRSDAPRYQYPPPLVRSTSQRTGAVSRTIGDRWIPRWGRHRARVHVRAYRIARAWLSVVESQASWRRWGRTVIA